MNLLLGFYCDRVAKTVVMRIHQVPVRANMTWSYVKSTQHRYGTHTERVTNSRQDSWSRAAASVYLNTNSNTIAREDEEQTERTVMVGERDKSESFKESLSRYTSCFVGSWLKA
ncbi:hypothetical protein ElyMa_002964800 [Elysia marginata]|uniref:Uncharacterized protein n=1 Tax=Elysia marginata TaxID=1093978 RepID=A0AAV4IA88_9GAST|nr:hypothetical protein ElyMa_002964800 [Elysia marginata]